MRVSRITAALVAAAATVALAAGCASDTGEDHGTEAESITVGEQWVKAADGGMTAAFAELTNTGHHDARVVSASSAASTRMEVHEVVPDARGAMTMRPKEGGVVVPAGESHTLAPGGDHLMFMDVTAPLRPGTDVDIVLTFEDGSTLPFTAQVRDFPGAEENYTPGDSQPSAPSMPGSGG